MQNINAVIRRGGLAAVIGLACVLASSSAQAGDTKPFKETFTESLVTTLHPGALPQPFFEEARALHGVEAVSAVIHIFTQSNVGGSGNTVAFENVHLADTATAPLGWLLYLMFYETTANGDKLVFAGTAIPQLDGSFVAHLEFLPDLCTGRFAGATGVIDSARAFPGGGVLEGTITTVGGTKK
jgi:hypothetical protein